MSIANQTLEMAKSIADSIDIDTYKKFQENPTMNDEYWEIRDYLNEAREQIGALYVYTLKIESPELSRGMIVGLPEDVPNFSIGEECTVPPEQVRLAYEGETFYTDVIDDPNYGNYFTVGAPIIDENGEVIEYIGIDMSTKTLNSIGDEVVKSSMSTFIFNVGIVLILVLTFLLIQNWYKKELKKAVGDTEQTYQDEFRTLIHSVKSIRHDFSNHIQVVHGLLELNHYEQAAAYVKSMKKEVQFVDSTFHVESPALLVLLQTKWVAAQNNQISVDFEVHKDQFEEVKTTDLIKILSNLIDNAMDATMALPNEDRKLKVVCKKDGSTYYFEVENTGPTIPDDHREQIFQHGFSTKKAKEKTRGYGLAIVKEIVENYGGDISIESANEITRFIVKIPV
ncbi:hypothetical protein GCM10008967_04220 [Bacillus carboniphilus]|uniref:histidine kinase n=2 Tax=Bacillus carboniphilus TaxID=86663 RepID=A0ABN0VU25_9BACI